MRNFIFLTNEGNTLTPELNDDIENLQVLGIIKGKNLQNAIENFIDECDYLLETEFNSVFALELKNETQHQFNLNDYKKK